MSRIISIKYLRIRTRRYISVSKWFPRSLITINPSYHIFILPSLGFITIESNITIRFHVFIHIGRFSADICTSTILFPWSFRASVTRFSLYARQNTYAWYNDVLCDGTFWIILRSRIRWMTISIDTINLYVNLKLW